MQCGKQEFGSNACGLFACTYLSECRKFSNSWKELKAAVKGQNSLKTVPLTMKDVKADICKFIIQNCVTQGEEFFDEQSDLAVLPEYEHLRKWRTPPDYKYILNLF